MIPLALFIRKVLKLKDNPGDFQNGFMIPERIANV
jgi:hypothetical protein